MVAQGMEERQRLLGAATAARGHRIQNPAAANGDLGRIGAEHKGIAGKKEHRML
jgi:hypothetical protein